MFGNYLAAFLVACPLLAILVLSAWRWLDTLKARRSHRNWGLTPGLEIVHRRGRWQWRTGL